MKPTSGFENKLIIIFKKLSMNLSSFSIASNPIKSPFVSFNSDNIFYLLTSQFKKGNFINSVL